MGGGGGGGGKIPFYQKKYFLEKIYSRGGQLPPRVRSCSILNLRYPNLSFSPFQFFLITFFFLQISWSVTTRKSGSSRMEKLLLPYIFGTFTEYFVFRINFRASRLKAGLPFTWKNILRLPKRAYVCLCGSSFHCSHLTSPVKSFVSFSLSAVISLLCIVTINLAACLVFSPFMVTQQTSGDGFSFAVRGRKRPAKWELKMFSRSYPPKNIDCRCTRLVKPFFFSSLKPIILSN